MDSSAGHEHHQEQIGLDVEAATGDTSLADLTSVPGEGSSTGNVTGGRKFARHHFWHFDRGSSRRGKSFGVGPVHKILTNTVYVGRWRFNQVFSKTGRRKAEDEIVEIPVPAIVDPDIFEQVQRQLHARSPKVQAPRMTTGPILLTGLAVCATCRAGMMLRTGTLSDADDKLKRLYQLIEEGVTDLDDVLKDRLNTLKAERDRAREALARAQEHQSPPIEIDPATIDRFARALRESFSTCSVPFRKAYLRALIDVIEVDDHQVRIKGSKSVLEKALVASQNTTSGCSQMSTRWRARRDSNS